MSMKDVALRPTIQSQSVIESVARVIVGRMLNRGGFDPDTACAHVAYVIASERFADGYRLTKILEDHFGWFNCNMQVAEAMDDAYPMLLSESRKQTKEWVVRNVIKPKSKLGEQVRFQYRDCHLDGVIVEVNKDLAHYLVDLVDTNNQVDKTGKNKIVVFFENVHDIVVPPEEFELSVQE